MYYSKWENKNEIKNYLFKIDYKKNAEHSGIPVVYEGNNVYTTNGNSHSLVIGSSGSGKTQTIILHLITLSMLANESIIINDVKGELYKKTAKEFKNRDYNVIVLDLENSIYGNYYNPLSLAQKLYKEKNKDKSVSIIENIGYYLFSDNTSNIDPFWTNSVIDYFTGLCLYLFEKENKEVTIKNIFELGNTLSDEKECEKFLKEIGKDNVIYYNVSGTLLSPNETKGGIVSTFNQKIKSYINKEKLSEMMSKTDFDITNIAKEKTVVYIVSGYYEYSNNLIPLFINQVFDTINIYGNDGRRTNIVLDEFDKLLPIKNFSEIINYSRSIKINFTAVIRSYIDLLNTYGKEDFEIIKLCFANIIYLYANDPFTLEEISQLCGNESEKKKLITPEELKMVKQFEAIFLIPRIMPFKNIIIPDYKINWGINFEEENFELRK